MSDSVSGVRPPVVDLHLHTTASDGKLTPTELIERVAGTTLRVVAVTDHDSTDGIEEALAAATGHPGLTVIPGLELGTEDGDSEVHLVAYFVDREAPGLQAYLERLRAGRIDAARGTVERLAEMGIHISFDRVLEIADGAVGRPHIARAMEEAGYVESARDAFQHYLGSNGAARVRRDKPTPGDGVNFIHSIGAAAVLAHPQTVGGLRHVLGFLVDEGLDGIEVFAVKYGGAGLSARIETASRNGLIATGGSDFHAWGNDDEVVPGDTETIGPPLETVDHLRAAAERWRSARDVTSGNAVSPQGDGTGG